VKNKQLYLLSLLSAFLLHLAWTSWFPGYIVLIGFIPLLMIEQQIYNNRMPAIQMYKYSVITFFIWNALDTWWLMNASFAGMLVAFLVNTFLFSGVFQLFHLFKRTTNPKTGYVGLLAFWLGFEYFYLNAEISWTWLNLGNAFAKNIKAIQWYEYTGTLGGTFWVLLVNIMLFNLIDLYKNKINKKLIVKNAILTGIVVFVPIIISLVIFHNYKEEKNPINVVAVQPNVDPYEKFIALSNREQTLDLIKTAQKYVDQNTDYVVCPETSITSYSDIDYLHRNTYIKIIREYLIHFPDMEFIVGFTLKKNYFKKEDITPTAKKYVNSETYFDTYNSAVQIDTSQNIQLYHKSQLVVGVEKMPYPKALKFLQKLMVHLGGTFRSHAIQEERSNLVSLKGVSVAPVICYENIFGEFVSDFIKKDARVIFVITNEGWWGDTQGHRYLNHLSRLRAIENRRSVVRSANTGTSSFINQRGELIQTLGWWKKGALKGNVNLNDKLTFYTVHGDYIGKIALYFSLLCVLFWIVQRIIGYKSKSGNIRF